jgi:hypothetical protein
MNPYHSAFARPATLYPNGDVAAPAQEGLTVREHIAITVLPAIVASASFKDELMGWGSGPIRFTQAADQAVQYADALIERLKVPQ